MALGWLFPEKRMSPASGDPGLIAMMSRGSQTSAGIYVTPDSALRSTPIFRAVEIISTAIGMFPLNFYRLTKTGKELAVDHYLFNLIGFKPNAWQDSLEWREMMTGHAILYGNAYSEIFWNNDGSASQLVPLNPARIRPFKAKDGSVWYEFSPPQGPKRNIAADEMLHLRGFSGDGLVGYARAALHREAIGLGMAAEEYEARFFSNDATPPVVITMGPENTLSPEAQKKFKEEWQQMRSGLPNSHKMAMLEEGMDIKTIGTNNKDAEFLALRKFQVLEASRITGVPAHMLAEMDRATFSNIEQQNQEFVDFCLLPWARRWEQRLKFSLLSAKSYASYAFGLDLKSLLRGDMAARAAFYTTMFNVGAINSNEIRDNEDMNPRGDGKGNDYYVSTNLVNATNPPPEPKPVDPKQLPAPKPEQKSALVDELRAAKLDLNARIVRKEVTALRRLAKKYRGKDLEREIEKFYAEFEGGEEYVKESRRLLMASFEDIEPVLAQWESERAQKITEVEMSQWMN